MQPAAPTEEERKHPLPDTLKADLDKFINTSENDFLKQVVEDERELAAIIGVTQFQTLVTQGHKNIVAKLREEVAKSDTGASVENSVRQVSTALLNFLLKTLRHIVF